MADKEIVINIKQQGALGSLASAMGGGSKSQSGSGGMLSSLAGASGGSTGGTGGLAGMLGGMTGALTGILAAVGGIAILVQSSKMLQMTIGRLMKMVMLLIRPIGDMLSVLLMPLMMLIRPLSLFVNAMFRPFVREARNAFRSGMKFFSMGMTEKGTDAMFTGLQLMAAPFIKLLVIALGEGLKLATDVIFAPIEMFLNALNGLGTVILSLIPGSEGAQEAWTNFMGEIISGTEAVKTFAKDNIGVGIDAVLFGIDEWAEGLIAHSQVLAEEANLSSELLKAMETNQIDAKTIESTMVKLDQTTRESFGSVIDSVLNDSLIFGQDFPGPISSALDSLVTKAQDTKTKIDQILSDAQAKADAMVITTPSVTNYDRYNNDQISMPQYDTHADYGTISGLSNDPTSNLNKRTIQPWDEAQDFIWRAGQGIQKFSSDDNIVATKNGTGGSGITINVGTIEATDPSGVKRVLDEMIQENMSKLR